MNWTKAGIFSIIGGLGIGFLVALILSTIGDCAIGTVAKAIGFGLPIGNVLGIGFYKKVFLNGLTKSDILGGFGGLILSGLGGLAGLFAMDTWGSSAGLFVALFGSCVGSLVGYAAGLRIIGRHEIRNDSKETA